MNPLRTFIAIRVTATGPLKKMLRQFDMLGRAVRPVTADNLHVTLKFLGETAPAVVPEVVAVIENACANQTAFETKLVGLGVFPHAGRPAVIWVGLDDASPLEQIAAVLENELEPLGFARERRLFHPHLTLARVKSRPPDDLHRRLIDDEKTEFGTATIDAVTLYQSELRPEGARYLSLSSTVLRTQGG
jgi:2'-5' RNA ligase